MLALSYHGVLEYVSPKQLLDLFHPAPSPLPASLLPWSICSIEHFKCLAVAAAVAPLSVCLSEEPHSIAHLLSPAHPDQRCWRGRYPIVLRPGFVGILSFLIACARCYPLSSFLAICVVLFSPLVGCKTYAVVAMNMTSSLFIAFCCPRLLCYARRRLQT